MAALRDDPLLLRERIIPRSELDILLSNKKRLRGFYEMQNNQISRFLIPLSTLKSMDEEDNVNKKRKKYNQLINLTFTATVVISAIQIYAAVLSKSSSIALITVDSVIDILAGIVIKWSNSKIKKIDLNRYPCGGFRFRSIGNVCYAFLMAAANVYVAFEGIRTIIRFSGESSSDDLQSIYTIAAALAIKITLLCIYTPIRNANSQIMILFEDQRNDVLLGVFGLIAFLLGSQIKWYVDPAGAITLSLVITCCWLKVAKDNFTHLAGVSADNAFLQFVTYKAITFNEKIAMIDSCKAYHSGPKYFIEVDIVMPSDTDLKTSHDVAQELQDMLEQLDDVDRAFVHVDYETSHKPEHFRKKDHGMDW